LWQWYERNSIKRVIDWCWSEEDKTYANINSIILLGKTLSWFFTNSNRYIRDKATKAFATLFSDRAYLLKDIISEFKDINDPYVLERVLAGSFGAITHNHNLSDNTMIAQYVYDTFLKERRPPVNILTRDYCKGIIEYVVSQGGVLEYDKCNLNPPFDYSLPDNIPPESWIKTVEIKKKGDYTDEERGLKYHIQFYTGILQDIHWVPTTETLLLF
jgi:hypothetical protein